MASRANHVVLLGCALLCAAALLCSDPAIVGAPRGVDRRTVAASIFPSPRMSAWPATPSRPASFSTSTRRSSFAPFRWPIPIAWSSIFPRSAFSFRPALARGRGLVKAFRYGLVMPGGSRIVFDLTGPAKIANSSVLDAANGQPPRLVLELEEVDRTAFVQSLAAESRPELRPAIADRADPPLRHRRRAANRPRRRICARDRDRSRPWRHR